VLQAQLQRQVQRRNRGHLWYGLLGNEQL
jgi:hypothetical protein